MELLRIGTQRKAFVHGYEAHGLAKVVVAAATVVVVVVAGDCVVEQIPDTQMQM